MSHSNKICVVVADSAVARFYLYNRKEKAFTPLDQLIHPESRLKVNELVSDQKGLYQKSVSFNEGGYSPHTEPKKVEAEYFGAEVAKALGKHEKQFERVVIFAPAHFQSYIKKKLSKVVAEKLHSYIDKNYTKIDDEKLKEYVKELKGL